MANTVPTWIIYWSSSTVCVSVCLVYVSIHLTGFDDCHIKTQQKKERNIFPQASS